MISITHQFVRFFFLKKKKKKKLVRGLYLLREKLMDALRLLVKKNIFTNFLWKKKKQLTFLIAGIKIFIK